MTISHMHFSYAYQTSKSFYTDNQPPYSKHYLQINLYAINRIIQHSPTKGPWKPATTIKMKTVGSVEERYGYYAAA